MRRRVSSEGRYARPIKAAHKHGRLRSANALQRKWRKTKICSTKMVSDGIRNSKEALLGWPEESMNEASQFEAEVNVQIAKASGLVRRFGKDVKPIALEKLAEDILVAFARAIGECTEELSPETRIKSLTGRKKWAVARAENPHLTPLQHIDETYPDRRQIGMCRRDLFDPRVDPKLYQALADWLRSKKDGPRNTIPSDFGLPTKRQITDQILESSELHRPVSLVSRLDESDARIVRARRAQRARRIRNRNALSKTCLQP